MLVRYSALAVAANLSIVRIAMAGGRNRRSDPNVGLGLSSYHALSDTKTKKAARESWLEMLRQWLVQCPQCFEIRLVVGAQEDARYICKDCGHGFFISRSTAALSNGPT